MGEHITERGRDQIKRKKNVKMNDYLGIKFTFMGRHYVYPVLKSDGLTNAPVQRCLWRFLTQELPASSRNSGHCIGSWAVVPPGEKLSTWSKEDFLLKEIETNFSFQRSKIYLILTDSHTIYFCILWELFTNTTKYQIFASLPYLYTHICKKN